MGCGQSKIGNFYSKNKKNKNGSKRNGLSIRSASIEQKQSIGNNKASKTESNGTELNRSDEQNGLDKSQVKRKPGVPGGGPLLQQTEISTSQLDFFRMLDEKIESGPDYDESADACHRAEHVSKLLRRWELASASWSSATGDPNGGNALDPRASLRGYQQHQQAQRGRASHKSMPPPLTGGLVGAPSAKDREGMRNIVGGRPESAPVFVQQRARVDGLQEAHPSPGMPRHVLEAISQSPTQSHKTPPGAPALNGEHSLYGRDAYRQQQQPPQSYELLRNSPSNPYVQQFQLQSRQERRRPGAGYGSAQMT